MQKCYQDNNQNRMCPGAERNCPDAEEMKCGCTDHKHDMAATYKPLAMAYVPMQKEPDIYEDLEKAYKAGTIFPALDFPFCGKR